MHILYLKRKWNRVNYEKSIYCPWLGRIRSEWFPWLKRIRTKGFETVVFDMPDTENQVETWVPFLEENIENPTKKQFSSDYRCQTILQYLEKL